MDYGRMVLMSCIKIYNKTILELGGSIKITTLKSMTLQTMQTISQVAIASGLIIAALGGYGSYYYQQKIDIEKTIQVTPTIDLCRRGISVLKIDDKTVAFDIPYCSARNANAYNVKLESAILLENDNQLKILSPFGDAFPDHITLTYETGKSITYTLSPFDYSLINHLYICIKGSYTNEDRSLKFPVYDIYKYNLIAKDWYRILGEEDVRVRKFLDTNLGK